MTEIPTSPARRRAIVGGFLALMVGAGFLNSVVKHEHLARISGAQAATSAVDLSASAFSSAWYCPGPLPVGHRHEQSAIAITNLSERRLSAELVVALRGEPVRLERVVLDPVAERVAALPGAKRPTYGAVSVIVNGTGVGVEEIATGPTGTASAPCTTHASTRAQFGAGSTKGFANMAISIYNPGATPAVAGVTFATPSGPVAPGELASLPIEPGRDVVFFVGRYLPQRPVLSALVSTISGHIAVGAMDFRPIGGMLRSSLVLGTPLARASWWFGPTLVVGAADQTFDLVNPTGRAVRVALSVSGPGPEATGTIGLAPYCATQYVVPVARIAGLEAATVRVVGRGSIVAERSVVQPGPARFAARHLGASLPATVPSGFEVGDAVVAPASAWLVAGASDAAVSEVVAIANTHRVPVSVGLYAIEGGTRRLLRTLEVGPLAIGSVNLERYVHHEPALALLVRATRSVVAGVTEYGLTGRGLAAPAPIPVR